jgi:amino acid transporter
LLTAGAVFSTTGTNSALMLVTPRILFAMAEAGQLPSVFARVHSRFRTPYVAILATALLGCACAMYSGFASLAAISAIARLLTYMSTSAALPVLRRTMPDAQRWFMVPGGAMIPIAALAISVWLLMGSTRAQILISVATLVAGAVVYVCRRAVRNSRPAAS